MDNNNDVVVYGFLLSSIRMKVNTVVSDEGIYTLIKGNGVEVKIDLGKAEGDYHMKVYGEHLDKINDVASNFGAEEVISTEDYLANIVHQALGYVVKNKGLVEREEKKKHEEMKRGGEHLFTK